MGIKSHSFRFNCEKLLFLRWVDSWSSSKNVFQKITTFHAYFKWTWKHSYRCVSTYMLSVPFMPAFRLSVAFCAFWSLLNSLRYTFKFQHSLCKVTGASSPFTHTDTHTHTHTHTHTVSTGMTYERFPCGMSLTSMAGGRNLCSQRGRREVVR